VPNINTKVLRICRWPPQFGKEELVRQHFSSVLNKDAEKIIFFRRKLYLFIPDYDDAAYQVDG
jgi:hypothetical protein